jgi:MFS family permease
VIIVLLVGLPRTAPAPVHKVPALRWRSLDPAVRRLLIASAALALATTPEAFLVLWAHDRGLEIVWVPLIWALASLAKMAVAYPAGVLSDRFGRTAVLAVGWGVRVGMLVALAFAPSQPLLVWILFVGFSSTLAATEAAERSLIGDRAAERERGTAFGVYHLVTGVLVLPGAVLFGALWEWGSSTLAFLAAAALTLAATLYMMGMGAFGRR